MEAQKAAKAGLIDRVRAAVVRHRFSMAFTLFFVFVVGAYYTYQLDLLATAASNRLNNRIPLVSDQW